MASAGFGGLIAHQAVIVLIMLVANSAGGTGAYPIFRYAQALYFLPYAILAVPIATALFPRISERAALPGRPGLAQLVGGSVRLVTAVSAIGAGVLVAAAPAAQVLFTVVYEMPELGRVVSILAVGVVGYSLLYHTSRVLYALDCPGAVLRVSVVGWSTVGVGVLAAWPLSESREATLTVLAAAMALGMTVAGLAGIAASRRKVGPGMTVGLVRTAVLAVGSSVISAFIGRMICDFILDLGHGVLPAIGGGAAGVVAAAALPLAVIYRADPGTWRASSWAVSKGAS